VSQQNQQSELTSSGKKKKPGIVYLSSIPAGYNVARTISFFSQFGKVGRVFLQPGIADL
jgi:ESF2/ABP1 family protein